ncbi:unnamed protein product [Orchesella dallaii]|uniref:Ig-like domain-containing protein n=1 Tax=Orchesella dallaii TaxID=48710 RepID=A0ABP1R7G8_9HEXA
MSKQILAAYILFMGTFNVIVGPEIILIESDPPLIETEVSKWNKTYTIPFGEEHKKQFIKLSCRSVEPNRWILWNFQIFSEQGPEPRVEKSVIRRGDSMIFVSYLSWTFVRSSVIDRNASCVFETDWTRNPDLFSRTLGSAVTVELKDEVYPGETWIGIVVITLYDYLGGSVEAAAEKGHSIQITLSNYWPFNEFWMFNSSVLPLTFAINETVELACLAVESLYMRGFEWRLGTKIILSDESSQTYHFNAKDSLHVTRRSITFREEYNDSELEPKTISCGGLLWNSKRWHMSNPLNYVLLDPVAPSGSVTHMLNKDGYDEFTCNYQGWPKPKVTWFISEQVVLITNIY